MGCLLVICIVCFFALIIVPGVLKLASGIVLAFFIITAILAAINS